MGATETRLRTVARALTWRAVAITVAVGLGWLITRDLGKSLGFGLAYNAIQLFTQYVHDRWWARVEWGHIQPDAPAKGERPFSVVAWNTTPEDALPDRPTNPAVAGNPVWAAQPTPWNQAQWTPPDAAAPRPNGELPPQAPPEQGAAERRPMRSAS